MELQIIAPPVADETEPLEHGLVALTEAISQLDEDGVAHGCLGGEFGYGADYENAVFSMHHYCWCERGDCPWCAGCYCWENCQPDTFGRYPMPNDLSSAPKGEKCDWCAGVHRWIDKGALPPDEHPHYGAPHFWHKATGLRVWWYKWIGRDMIVLAPPNIDLQTMFSECLSSLPTKPQ